ncbi:hypothetical protein B0H14DRAFT_2845821 [Mycena olivaceomarginata]|nr:hypothetical protein B0H14DRAFT_2845821 [Mycena olivaceomarginata]
MASVDLATHAWVCCAVIFNQVTSPPPASDAVWSSSGAVSSVAFKLLFLSGDSPWGLGRGNRSYFRENPTRDLRRARETPGLVLPSGAGTRRDGVRAHRHPSRSVPLVLVSHATRAPGVSRPPFQMASRVFFWIWTQDTAMHAPNKTAKRTRLSELPKHVRTKPHPNSIYIYKAGKKIPPGNLHSVLVLTLAIRRKSPT